MSADNGIYILQTRGPEYRVAYHQNIDEVYGTFDDDSYRWNPNQKVLLEYFQSAPMFTDIEEALDFAEQLSYDYEYLEDGVCVISDFVELDYNNLKEDNGTETEGDSR
jgi:hypothetical protein